MDYVEVVELLLEMGDPADVNRREPGTLFSPLHAACYRDAVDIATMLLAKGADPNAQGQSRSAPLHIAADRQNVDIVDMLIGHGADASVRDCFGRTPGTWAAAAGKDAITARLVAGDTLGRTTTTPGEVSGRAAPEEDVVLHATVCGAIQKMRMHPRSTAMEKKAAARQAWVLARALLLLGDEENAAVALEMNISECTKKVDVFCFTCSRSTHGHIFVCKTCRDFDMCADCHEEVLGGGGRSPMCEHDNFLKVPRPCWQDLPLDVVSLEGTTVDQWLAGLLARYDGGTD
jgi:hypothetical protein